ncbi:hypothetical protein COO91_03851 [Nostoc flagelliforme CCNUN1]|uniref:Uncharacterized protein n=1 Tax=Nostoc flagelliforme CCNUN1 TaxID=2038116 RepID=A0A2K8SR06_9NOSO|nr:hypothetical protein COO91_03851 [Nostoc flagelliforme CCNUN1]
MLPRSRLTGLHSTCYLLCLEPPQVKQVAAEVNPYQEDTVGELRSLPSKH